MVKRKNPMVPHTSIRGKKLIAMETILENVAKATPPKPITVELTPSTIGDVNNLNRKKIPS